eukprot:6227129-Pyramimonas_sp.AAC.1
MSPEKKFRRKPLNSDWTTQHSRQGIRKAADARRIVFYFKLLFIYVLFMSGLRGLLRTLTAESLRGNTPTCQAGGRDGAGGPQRHRPGRTHQRLRY